MKFIIAGPCVIPDEKLCLEIADTIKQIGRNLNVEMIFKGSFDKANRTSISSYRGPGLEEGLRILSKVEKEIKLRVTTDIHESYQAKPVGGVCQILQIPALLCRQTDLLVAAAKTGKIVNVKKGQFLAPTDCKWIVQKLAESGCKESYLTERGSCFGRHALINDWPGMIEMAKYAPVIFDATHSCQSMGGEKGISGGNRELIEPLARAAVAIGVSALFFETYPDPEKSPSDGPNMVKLDKLEGLIRRLLMVDSCVPKLIIQ